MIRTSVMLATLAVVLAGPGVRQASAGVMIEMPPPPVIAVPATTMAEDESAVPSVGALALARYRWARTRPWNRYFTPPRVFAGFSVASNTGHAYPFLNFGWGSPFWYAEPFYATPWWGGWGGGGWGWGGWGWGSCGGVTIRVNQGVCR